MAFTGHRTYDGSHDAALCDSIRRHYALGFRTFLTGMAAGFDISAGECVAALKSELPELRLCCVVPFGSHRRSFAGASGIRYDRLIDAADEVVTLRLRYEPRAYHLRNDYLVDNASAIIAWYDGSKGGTEYTVRRAVSAGLEIENLWLGMFDVDQF